LVVPVDHLSHASCVSLSPLGQGSVERGGRFDWGWAWRLDSPPGHKTGRTFFQAAAVEVELFLQQEEEG